MDIPTKVRTSVLMQSRGMFVDRGLTVKGADPKIVDWVEPDKEKVF